jgi:crotonobetainyl-CoA:carnitine CoA-transferase CaiB-like acyl-CoA transferase
VLDLRNPAAPAVLKRISDAADVLVESHRPGQADDRGIGYAAIGAGNAGLVWCSITGFGDFGPNAHLPGHDLTYLGYSGLLSRLSDGPPRPPRSTVSLPLAGCMAVVGILAALSERQRTGVGRRVDVNMTDSATWTLSEELAREANQPGPGWGTSAGRDVYVCADGRRVTVAAGDQSSWVTLCEALGEPDLVTAREDAQVDDALPRQRLAARFRTEPSTHWLSHPGPAGGVGPVNEVADLLGDPQLLDRGSLVNLVPSGRQVFANPIRYDHANGSKASSAVSDPPELGRDTDDILVECGYSAAEVEALRAGGVIG